MTTNGVDYSFSRPDLPTLKKAGITFIGRYLATNPSGKVLTPGELAHIRALGMGVVLYFEDDSKDAESGYAGGQAHAHTAHSELVALGMPDAIVHFTIDENLTGTALLNYIHGAASVLGYSNTGAYGGYHQILSLAQADVCPYFIQTIAWSNDAHGNTQWAPQARIRQASNGITMAGGQVDRLVAVTSDYGQWPRYAPVASSGLSVHQRNVLAHPSRYANEFQSVFAALSPHQQHVYNHWADFSPAERAAAGF